MSQRITEEDSRHDDLERMSVADLVRLINSEDQTVALSVQKVLPHVAALAQTAADRMQAGGRMFYIGAGTSGRLGIVDASECPPTFGIEHGRVIGLIAGGDAAIRKAVEFAEDNPEGGWNDLQQHGVTPQDIVIGIAASGTTPYVVGALEHCRQHGITTGCIVCNPGSPLAQHADYTVEVVVGPEFVTGSTRMKAGTAQKMILNMISTSVMIRLGRVKGNKMVDMQLSNKKLISRGTKMIMDALQVSADEANELLQRYGSVRKALDARTK